MLTLAFNIQPARASGTLMRNTPAVGVKAGDWIKCDYTIIGWPAGTAYPEWLKVGFLSVEGTNSTVQVTMHMSDGTEQNTTVPVDVVAGGEALGVSGFVIPANLTVKDVVYISGYGNVAIAGETNAIYAGAHRTVVHASFSLYGTQLAYCWDKQTGVMVGASTTSGTLTATAKATETNMWQPQAIGPFYIRADGSIDPSTGSISTVDNVTYTLNDNLFDSIVIERDNITLDGGGYTLQGTGVSDSEGIDLFGRSNVTVKNTNIKSFFFGILLNSSSKYNSISGNAITDNSGVGIGLIYSSDYNSISGNNLTNNYWEGVGIGESSNNSISGNAITNNIYYGIALYTSSNNSISENDVANNQYGGISLDYYSNCNSIEQNTIANNDGGIRLGSSSNNSISGNTITSNNNYGIYLTSSSCNNDLSGNTFTDGGLAVWDSYSNSVENNTVNGRPLVYLEGVADYSVGDAGQVVLVKCDRIRVEDLNLSRTFIGVQLWETNNSIISGNNIATSWYGIEILFSSNNSINGNNVTNSYSYNTCGIALYASSNNSISENNITDNKGNGIEIGESSNNSISENVITNNYEGIDLASSSNNDISGNTITNNIDGIWLGSSSNNSIGGNAITDNIYSGIGIGYDSSNNTFCHNNFINNTRQVIDWALDQVNFWDNGCEGNYWGDYNGTDLYSGPYQNITGSDGIGDTAYVIDENNQDRYPLGIFSVSLLGDLNQDGIVNVLDAIQTATAFGSYPGHPNWNEQADINRDGVVNILDVIVLANNFGKH